MVAFPLKTRERQLFDLVVILVLVYRFVSASGAFVGVSSDW